MKQHFFFCSVLAVLIVWSTQLNCQTFSVLHNFSGPDGAAPLSGVSLDAEGNLYGTTYYGGSGNGVVYKLSRDNSSWLLSLLHSFVLSDGAQPIGKPLIANDGTLYLTANAGGQFNDGTAVHLQPQPTRCASILCPWQAIVIHNFALSSDGAYPVGLNFGAQEELIGATTQGGAHGDGTVFKLTSSQNSWVLTLLTDFRNTSTGDAFGGVIADPVDNIYGAGAANGNNTVFEITNAGQLQILYQFPLSGVDGLGIYYGLVRDGAGNLYGLAVVAGEFNGGTVYELSPSGGGWSFNLLYNLPSYMFLSGTVGSAALTMDSQGNLYGTHYEDGANSRGSVFKLTPSENGWIYTDLHDFTGGSDGCYPWSDVVMDSSGNLYGTASYCGSSGYGTVWEITP